jgi:hypothetical protein
VSTFTYGPAIVGLISDDPLSPENLEKRKEHLHRMAELVFTELSAGSSVGKRRSREDRTVE